MATFPFQHSPKLFFGSPILLWRGYEDVLRISQVSLRVDAYVYVEVTSVHVVKMIFT